MQEEQLLRTQADRDRLVTLRKARKRRLVASLKQRGDRAVLHGLKGNPSNNQLAPEHKAQALVILGSEAYRGFAPTYAAERLAEDHGLVVSRETVRR